MFAIKPWKHLVAIIALLVSQTAFTQSTTPQVTSTMTSIFELAEQKVPEYFPPGAITAFFENYVYRFYTSTGVYVAFADGNVYLMGGVFGNSITNAGAMSSVLSALQAFPTPSTGGGGTPAVQLWNLTISGSIQTPFVPVAFSGITLNNVPAPDLSNTNQVNQEITSTLSGVATGISSIKITVVNNTSTRRTFDVTFSATLTGFGAVTYNLRYDYTQ